MKRFTPYILFFAAILSAQIVFGQFFKGSVYKDVDKMPSSRMVAVAQCPNGEIWFGTQSGLISYDGLNWNSLGESIDYIPTFGQVEIIPMDDNRVFIIGSDGKKFRIACYDQGEWTNLQLPPSLEKTKMGSTFCTAKDQNGQLFIGVGHNLYIYSNGNWSDQNLLPDNQELKITSITPHKDQLFIGTTVGLYQVSRGTVKQLLANVSVLKSQKNDLDDNHLYIMSENLLGKFDLTTLAFDTIYDRKIGSAGNSISLISKGQYVYFSYNSPLYRFNTSTGDLMPILTKGFADDHTCMGSIFDQEGNLWVVTLRGAFKINNPNVFHYTAPQLIENEVSATYEDRNGDIFLGTNSGLNLLKSNGQIEQYKFDFKNVLSRVMDIEKYQDKYYLAVSEAGVMTFENGKLQSSLRSKHNITDLQIYRDTLYCAGLNSVYKLVNNKWEIIKKLNDSSKMLTIRKIVFENDDKYLITTRGVYDFKQNQWMRSDNAHSNNIYAYIKYNNQILLGTSNGICELKNNVIVPAGSQFAKLSEPIYAFLKSNSGTGLWIGTGSGVYFNHFDEMTRLWSKNGLVGNEINRNAFQFLSDGKLLVGTDEGVSFVDPVYNSMKDPIPRVEIMGFELLDGQVDSIPKTLPYKQKDISIHYRAISFFDESSINYRVRLQGFNEEWQYIPYNNQRSVLYNNLQPGKYQFEVQARIGDGKWSDSATSSVFQINSAVYQRWWFRLTIGIILVLGMFAIFRYRNQQLKKRNERLEEMVSNKTHELNERNKDLVATIRELKAAQGQLIQSEKLASMGHLTAGIAHELNNPLNYIRGGAECIIRNINELNELMRANQNDVSAQKSDNILYLMNENQTLAESILTGASKSTDIIKSLNSFSADSQNYFSYTDLEKEVETALTLLSNQFGFRITINKLFGNVPPVECYPAKINQLIVNLLLNAIQSIESNGEITIRIFRKDSKFICLEISDTGEGIAPENYDMVFEPFFTTKETNSGLGLTISEAIVQEHNGMIKIRSRRNEGTKVAVWLPANQETGSWEPEII